MDARIYYGDGTTFEGDIAEAPVLNVLAIVYANSRNGRRVLKGHDYYLYTVEFNGWIGVDNLVDLVDHILYDNVLRVLKGRTIRDETYHRIAEQAMADSGFPVMSASGDPWERGEN